MSNYLPWKWAFEGEVVTGLYRKRLKQTNLYMWENKISEGASVAFQKTGAELQDAIRFFSIFMFPVLQSERKKLSKCSKK